ncbi:MAG: 30S ribosomal protein S2 [Alphaproteobacteria bacterium]|jgi:small subunit ribosomal protein S2|nr:30S ribosomal protein S2 [Alphaproteobacteria bacterium]
MSLPNFSMRDLLQAGVHFGHHPRRWNPKMAPYLFGERNSVHIINLEKTYPLLKQGLQAIKDVVASGGRVLVVGTKRQASDVVAQEAARCSQYYVNHRWLGGMLTNWKTVSHSIHRLKDLSKQLEEGAEGLTKKELLQLTREHEKLNRSLGGIQNMGGVPDILFVIDTNKEKLAIQEANKLGIPVVGILDSNSDPAGITYPVPGNDDAIRSIEFYCRMVSSTVLEGLQTQMRAAGIDLGASLRVPGEQADFAEADAAE